MFIIIIELISYQLHKFDVQAKRNPQITRNRETIVNPCTRRIHIKIEDSTNKKKKDKKSTKHNNFSTFQTESGGRGERRAYLVDSKKLASRFISSWRNLAISSSILRISESKRSRMLLNSVSITLKSPNLMGIFLLLASAIFNFSVFVCVGLR